MHGSSTGLVAADASHSVDSLQRVRDALTLFNATSKAACDLSEHHLQRVAEDAAARCIGLIEALEKEARERLRRSEAVHGQDSEAAQVA
jgi:hypothetical protein